MREFRYFAPRRQGPMPAIGVDVPMMTGGRSTWGTINVEHRRPAGRGGSVVGERLKGAGARRDRLGSSASSRDLVGDWGRQRAATDRMRKGVESLVAGLVSRRWEKGKASSSSLAPSCCEASWGSCGPPRWSAACRGLGCHGGEGSDAAEGSGATSRRGRGVVRSCAVTEETEAATDCMRKGAGSTINVSRGNLSYWAIARSLWPHLAGQIDAQIVGRSTFLLWR